MNRLMVFALIGGCLVSLAGCSRYNSRVLDCEGEEFLTKEGYYSCCRTRDLRRMADEMERSVIEVVE